MPNGNRASLTAFLALFLVCAAAFFWMVSGLVVAVFMGQILAFLLTPLHSWLRRRGWKAGRAALACSAILAFGVMAPLAGLTAAAAREGVRMEHTIAESGALTAGALVDRLDRLGLRRLAGDPEQVKQRARDLLHEAAGVGAGAAAGAARAVPRAALAVFIGLLTCFFMLREEDSLLRLALAPLPLDPEIVAEAQAVFQATSSATFWASLSVAVAQAAVLAIAFLALGLKGIFLATGLVFVGAWIPLIGGAPVWLAAAAWLTYEGRMGALLGLLGFACAAYMLDHILRPIMLRGRARLHPLLGLVSALGGLEAFGLAGVFIGPVVASLLASFYRVWPRTALRHDIDVRPSVIGPG